jgi:acyl dehydratase
MSAPVVPGAVLGPVDHRIGITDIVRYAGASGDFNSIHHDLEVARAGGYERVFAMGMLSAGYLGSLLVEHFGHEAVESLSVRFRDRVWQDDVVTCRGEVVAVEDRHVRVTLTARVGERLVIDGRAVVRLVE